MACTEHSVLAMNMFLEHVLKHTWALIIYVLLLPEVYQVGPLPPSSEVRDAQHYAPC